MKRFNLFSLEWNRHTINLLAFYYNSLNWGFCLVNIDSETFYPNGHYFTSRWYLFKIDYYKQLASWATVRADFEFFGRQFVWKRKTEPISDDLPF